MPLNVWWWYHLGRCFYWSSGKFIVSRMIGCYNFPSFFNILICKENHPLKHSKRCVFFVFIRQLSGKCPHSEFENCISPNYSIFAAECDWKSKISQNVRNLVIFQRKTIDFLEKNSIFFKIGKGGRFAVHCVSNDIISKNISFQLYLWSFFAQKNRKFSNLENLKNLLIVVFILLKGIFNNIGEQKKRQWLPVVLLNDPQ